VLAESLPKDAITVVVDGRKSDNLLHVKAVHRQDSYRGIYRIYPSHIFGMRT
jgi:hypothetical protein